MNALFRAAADVLSFCEERGWQSCVIGGLAVQRWSDPRLTRDADLTLLTGLGGEERFVDPLLTKFVPRVHDARSLALHRRVLLLQTTDGVPVDVALGGLPFESRVMSRRSQWYVPAHVDLITCSAEDLVVMKSLAGRVQDWLDVEGVVARQGSQLDRLLILEELRPLLALKEDEEAERSLQRLFDKHQP